MKDAFDARVALEKRALEIFEGSCDLPEAEATAWIQQQVGNNPELGEEVQKLLRADAQCGEFLETPGLSLDTGSPTTLGGWQILKSIGEGGMGRVYLAQRNDRGFEQLGAVKVMRQLLAHADPEKADMLRKRFENERQILAHINHDGIARVLDGGTTSDGVPYLVMEYVQGERIDAYCRNNDLDLNDRLKLLQQVLSAVAVVHQNLFVHRDIKPSNVLVTADGAAKLLDFGIAKALQDQAGIRPIRTATQMNAMTPDYASPEQVAGHQITTASDIYSMGLLAYELLTGSRPYDLGPATPAEAEDLIRHVIPTAPSERISKERAQRHPITAGQLKGDLDQIILKALRKEPEQRYGTASEMAADLERHMLGLPVNAQPSSTWYRLGKFARRHQAGVLASCIALAALLTALGVSVWQTQLARSAADRADASSRFLEEVLASASPYGSEHAATLVDAIDLAATKIEDRFKDQPLLESDIRQTIGNAYQAMGKVDEGAAQFERALMLRQAAADPYDIAETLHGIGLIHWWRAQYEEGEARFLEAADMLEAHTSASALALRSAVLNDLGGMLLDPGRTDEALAYLRESLALVERLPEPDPEATRGILGNMLIAARRLKDQTLAETLFSQASAISESLDRDVDPTYAAILNNYATVLEDQERWQEAGELYERAIRIHEAALGPGNSFTVVPLMNLSKVTRLDGNPEAAIVIAQRSVASARTALARGHPLLGKALVSLAFAYRDAGQPAQARRSAMEAEEIYGAAEAVNSAWLEEVRTLLQP